MTSILTNTSAMAALQTLRSINSDMETTQNRISSGLKVEKASDNAAYWSIATTMRSDNKSLSAVSDALGMGAAKVDTAYEGISAAIEVVQEIQAKLVAASEEGLDKSKVQEEIEQLQDQLKNIAKSASFNGENWIMGTAGTKTVVSGFVRDSNGAVSVETTDYALVTGASGNVMFATIGSAGTASGGILGTSGTVAGGSASVINLDITSFGATAMADALTLVDQALGYMTSAASKIGSISTRIGLQEDFVNNLMDSIDRGIGRLVDADMNEESTRLKALQTQQQLGIQSLSIANSNSQNILQLFQG